MDFWGGLANMAGLLIFALVAAGVAVSFDASTSRKSEPLDGH
jgi:hypothetical protein